MRIAHLTWSMGIGGIQTMLAGIASIQAQMGHDVAIFILDNRIDDSIMSKLDPMVKVFCFGRTRGTLALTPFIKLNWQLWRFSPDIIHSHSGKLSKAVFSRVPMVATLHGMNRNPAVFSSYAKCFAISESVKNDFLQRGYASDVTVIENGIPCEEIRCKDCYELGDTIHIVQVSRISFSPKRQDLAVTALSIIKKHSLNRKVMLHFIGDGPDACQLKEMVQDLGVEDAVVFEGPKDRKWVFEHLRDYDLFLQPSDNEGFGLTVAEACAAKLPVLVSDVDGPMEIIDGGRLGMVFKHGDAKDLAGKICEFIQEGYPLSKIKGAYENTLREYDIATTTRRYVREYEKVINSKKR